MSFLSIFILALIQGITEFLPISSSAHLILAHDLLGQGQGWGDNQMIDVAVHIGTLASVLLYFHKDFIEMISGVFNKKDKVMTGIGMRIIVASIPVIIAGFILHAIKPDALRTIEIIAWTTLIGGILLWVVDAKCSNIKSVQDISWIDAILIGVCQVFALIPGVSRSGITMTAARWRGLSRVEAARFSLFLGVISIAGAGTLGAIDIVQSGDARLGTDAVIAGFLSFLFGLASITLMMKFLENKSFAAFGIYRILLGTLILVIIHFTHNSIAPL